MIQVVFFVCSFPFSVGPAAVDAPEHVQKIQHGAADSVLTGDDVLALERHVPDGVSLIRLTDGVLDAECTGVTSEQMNASLVVGQRLLSLALLEAAKKRAGAPMALTAAAEVAHALHRCLPFGIGGSQAKELAQGVSSTTAWLYAHGALEAEDVKAVAAALAPVLPEALAKASAGPGPVVTGVAIVKCRKKGDATVLSAVEAASIGKKYQQQPPAFEPAFRNSRMVGMSVVVDAFLSSCGLERGDVVVSVNGVELQSPDRLLLLEDRIKADRQAVVVVLRGGTPLTLTIVEDK